MMPETEGGCKLGDEGAVTVYMCVLLRERFVTTLGGASCGIMAKTSTVVCSVEDG